MTVSSAIFATDRICLAMEVCALAIARSSVARDVPE